MNNLGFCRPVVMYNHAGSGNHGCEAIANSLLREIDEFRRMDCENGKSDFAYKELPPVLVVSNSAAEDRKYSLGELEKEGLCQLIDEKHMSEHLLAHIIYYAHRKVTGDEESFLRYRFSRVHKAMVIPRRNFCRGSGIKPLALSIGGDNYCYPEMVHDLVLADRVFLNAGYETALVGCSIEPASIGAGSADEDAHKYSRASIEELVADLRTYKHIITREQLTYNALLEVGFDEDKVTLEKDPAFRLETEKLPLPNGFIDKKTVGINVSPMVQGCESKPGITMANYQRLIEHIIETTDMQVALIPHVVWANNDDRKPLSQLYSQFKDTGRVVLIEDHTAPQIKGFIARCAFFIGARTHSTIAAYSSKVPTLVLGYSIKSRGIARDLFGQEEGYVVPVQNLQSENDLVILAEPFLAKLR